MKFRQIGIIASVVFLSGLAQIASAANGPEITLNNQLGNGSYLVMNFDVIETEDDVQDVRRLIHLKTYGHLVSYQEDKVFNDFQKMDNFSFTKDAGGYSCNSGNNSGNYICAGIGSTTLTPDFSCQNLGSRFNPAAKNITITVRKSTSPTKLVARLLK